jgi:hypothetical protein
MKARLEGVMQENTPCTHLGNLTSYQQSQEILMIGLLAAKVWTRPRSGNVIIGFSP